MIARFTEKQPFVKVINLGENDYVYLCLNEREVDIEMENYNENPKDSIRTEHLYEYDYDEFSVPINTLDRKDLYNDPEKYLYMNLRKNKLVEISKICEKTIYNGVDIELSDGIFHFSLTPNDQINLFCIKNMITDGKTDIEYHSDGEPFKFYSTEDANKIIYEAMSFITYHRAYCNSLNMWIKNTNSEDEINSIYYGIEIPLKYHSEVLKSYNAHLMNE